MLCNKSFLTTGHAIIYIPNIHKMNQNYLDTDFRKLLKFCLISLILPVTYCTAQYRPQQFFREDWKEIPAATPATQAHVTNRDLILGLYGPGCDSIKKSHHETPADDPYYIWSGLCTGNWVVTLKNTKSYVDLRSFGKILWRSKQSGLRCLHLVLRLADDTWLVGSQGDCLSKDWRITEFNIADIVWYSLDIKSVTEVKPISNPDLSKVDEIGFTDLMTGGASDACSRLDWIEVYGKPVKR
jgi:hypothetical protein